LLFLSDQLVVCVVGKHASPKPGCYMLKKEQMTLTFDKTSQVKYRTPCCSYLYIRQQLLAK